MEKAKIIESGASLDVIYREIAIHKRANHENIVKFHSFHEDAEKFYIILDYKNGGTLFNFIKRTHGVSEQEAFKFFFQVAKAVEYLHDRDLVHRDLKPENILLDLNDNVFLCDFGWCVDLSTGNRVTFCGTYEYMAPEILKELPYDFAIDVWSLGILLYELIHGFSPFRASETANQNAEDEEYIEIFKNIIKNKFKFEKEGLSENCKDLIGSKLFVNFRIACAGHQKKNNHQRHLQSSLGQTNAKRNAKELFSRFVERNNKRKKFGERFGAKQQTAHDQS